jgi:aspartate/methionine/tyrosine aminotransferase
MGMIATDGLAALASGGLLSPFTRTARLLAGIAPGHAAPIDMSAGDPREVMPGFVAEKLTEAKALFATYPKIRCSDELRAAITTWIGRRYGANVRIDPAREVLPVNGSREGLFFAALPAVGRKRIDGRPAMLIVNPCYQPYVAAALATGCEPVYLDATAETGYLPDLDALEREPDILARATAFYLCSPANPQGAVASADYIRRALALARRHDFMLFCDECYSEIYTREPPPGALQVAAATPERFANLVVFNSLSKRSNLPGLRSGFVAGDGDFLQTLAEIRNLTAPQMPGPVQHASAAVWSEEQHVTVIRRAYDAKFDVADELLTGRFGYRRPAGGFFLWLDVGHFGNSEQAALTIWQKCGVKVVPGVYLAQEDRHGVNPGRNFIRVALVHDAATVRQALERVISLRV